MGDHLLRTLLVSTVGCALACPGAAAPRADDPSGNRIAREVRHELLMLPYFKVFDHLTFRVEGSTITLLGQVTRRSLKSDADNAVMQIAGVRRVVNQIEVLPLSTADDRLRLAVYVATYGQPNLSQYAVRAVPPVHIIVKHGNVTLEGSIDNPIDKTQFFTQASSVPGVVSVTNHLQITS